MKHATPAIWPYSEGRPTDFPRERGRGVDFTVQAGKRAKDDTVHPGAGWRPPAPGKEATVPVPAAAGGGPVSHAIFRLARLHRMLAGQLLRCIGLHPGQELVMMHLWELGARRQTDLVRLMDSDAATMTRTVRRLEQAGFVRRRPSPTDRRASLIEPTAAGHALRREVEQSWSRLEDLAAADLSADERTAALHTLERLERALGRAAAGSPSTNEERERPDGAPGAGRWTDLTSRPTPGPALRDTDAYTAPA